MSTIVDFLGKVILEREDGTSETLSISEAAERAAASYAKCAWMETALHTAVGYAIAGLQKCPIRIRGSDRGERDFEEWLWNVRPNANQSHSQFVAALVDKMFFGRQGAALVVPARDSIWIADGWTEFKEPGKPTIYENISIEGSTQVAPRGLPADRVFVFRVPETGRWRTLMRAMAGAYDELAKSATEAFADKNARRWLLKVDQQLAGTGAQVETVANYLRDSVGPFTKGTDAALPLWRGYDLTRMDSDASTGGRSTLDVVQIRQEAFRTVANCLRIPVSFLEGNVNNFETVFESFLTFFVDSIAKAIEDEIAAKSLTPADWQTGGYARVDTTHVRHVDLFAVADKVEKLVGSSIDTPNEIRAFTGQEPAEAPGMDDYQMTKNHEVTGGGANDNARIDTNAAADGE